MARRSRKGFEGWRRKYLSDLRHMHQCMLYGRLPEAGLAYIEQVLGDPLNLPKPREVAKRVQFTNDQREANKLWSIPPVDMTKAQLAKQRREKDKQRKLLARRRAHAQSREIYLAQFAKSDRKTKPWEAEGISRRTWFRRKGRTTEMMDGDTGFVRTTQHVAPGSSARI